ncbi:MAG: DNA topoisomerase VI subunit B [Phycisphaerales bacterium]
MATPALLEEDTVTESKPRKQRVTAETMAAKQRDISVSEFFAKNRHLLGFDNPRKALLTTVKEAVDNSLDACEEAGILPEIVVVIEELEEAARPTKGAATKDSPEEDGKTGKKSKAQQSAKYRVTVVDNGPGIVRKQVENVFGRLLFGSKFHRLKMSRGQQGIGISAAGMYGLITTGRPMVIHTKPKANSEAHHIELAMNTKLNRAEVTVDVETDDFPPTALRTVCKGSRDVSFMPAALFPTGTSVSVELEGKYQKGRGSVDEFLELTAIANPHARITFIPPTKTIDEEDEVLLDPRRRRQAEQTPTAPAEPAAAKPPPPTDDNDHGLNTSIKTEEKDGVILFPRAVGELPPETKEIQPHPRGIELGILLQMLKEHPGESVYKFLQENFSRVSAASASDFCKAVGITARTLCSDIDHDQSEALFRALQSAKLPPPPTDCLAPIGVRQLLAGLLKGVRAEFYAASSREPDIYRGRPFLIEAAVAFGGELAADDSARVIRFANRVPLLYQQSACSSFKAVTETNWRNYDLQHPRNALPVGPLVIMIHMASVWVPFTSESKEAIADYDEIRKEMKLALMECGRKLGTYLRKRAKMKRESERRDVFQKYIGEIAQACNALTGVEAKKLYEALLTQARRKTAIADAKLDEEGKRIKEEDEADLDGVVIIQSESSAPGDVAGSDEPPATRLSKAEAARLKVAAMAGDDEPSLLDVKPVGRLSQTGRTGRDKEPRPDRKAAKKEAAPAKPASRPEGKAARPGPAPSRPAPQPSPTTPAGKAAKPKMRLVNGKLVPVDDGPKLF